MKNNTQKTIYPHPFSREYWKDAARQLADVRILCIAAILIAVRVALKSVQIPVGPDLNITIGFFVNALGASVFGPVVAIVAAAISDTLGCILFPTGAYFFPFIFVEIAGSLIFALFLWRAKLSATRIMLSRFFVSAVCNFIMNPTIMIWYYAWLNNGKKYVFLTVPRVVKNLALFPAEALLLVLFLGAMLPALIHLSMVPKSLTPPKLMKKHIVILVILALFSVGIVGAYYTLYYPTQPRSEAVTKDNVKLTLKSERGTYEVDADSANAPLALTATLKNTANCDITVKFADITLVSADGNVIGELNTEAVFEEAVVAHDKSYKITDSFSAEYAESDGLEAGKYTAAAKVAFEINGEDVVIESTLPIKIK